jgi:hypothetical protein
MIQEAPMWLLLPAAGLAWLAYLRVVLAERRERAYVDRRAEQHEPDSSSEQPHNQHGEQVNSHGVRVSR